LSIAIRNSVIPIILLHYASLVAAITIVVTNVAGIFLAFHILCGFLIRIYIIVTWRSPIDIDDINGDVLVGIGVTGRE
jgi:hypothetical protein